MAKVKHLSTRQHKTIEELFSDKPDEQAVLDKYNISRTLYNKWLIDETFTEQFDKRIAASYRQSAAIIARNAPLAAAKLVKLTDSDKPETARKVCLNIISKPSSGTNTANPTAAKCRNTASAENESQQLSAETAGKLLAVLAEENMTR